LESHVFHSAWAGRSGGSGSSGRHVLRKLPHVTLLFWILKIIAVTLGETAGDLFGITLQVGYVATALIFLVFFLVVLVAQVRANDSTLPCSGRSSWHQLGGHRDLGPLQPGIGHGSAKTGSVRLGASSSPAYGDVFLVWWRGGHRADLRRGDHRQPQGEILYWIAILVSNTLGTSSGDWLSDAPAGFRNAFFVIAGSWWRSWPRTT